MANQWGDTKPVYQKCAEPTCDNQVRRVPHEVKSGQHTYCSPGCAYKKASRPRKYNDDAVLWISQNILTMDIATMAKKMKVTENALKRSISALRRNGHAIPRKKKRRVFTGEEIKYIKGNIRKFTLEELAKKLNTSASKLGRDITNLRKSGHDIPTGHKGIVNASGRKAKAGTVKRKAETKVSYRLPKKEVIPIPTKVVPVDNRQFVLIRKGTYALRAVS